MHPTPPPGYAVRRPTPDDLGRVDEFLVAVTVAEFGEPDYSEGDLRNEWAELDLAADAWLLEAPNGELAGYVSLSHREHVRLDADGYVHPAHEGRGVGTFLVRATEERAREHLPLAPAGARVVLNNGVNGRNPRARSLLEREGYVAVRHFWRMSIDLADAPPPPAWPPGIAVRTPASAADDRLAHAATEDAFRDHWGHVYAPFEDWIRRRKGEGHDPGLWFLASDGEEVAGIALCRYDDGIGWVDSLGVRPAWRRRDLGQALLRHALAEFVRRGYPRAALGVDAANETGATRLYESAGLRADNQYAVYQMELRPETSVPGHGGAV
ncbi:MAG: GNAT family N-acetyltransferase [Chloroflexota bacterium]|nr:GNAT family N-acetyltransferase [Chloroflexota bacterium]